MSTTQERNTTHWLSDGNVILSAVTKDKARTVLFRIRMSLLSDESEVFATLLALPQGEGNNQEDMYEGIPLVRLPDSAEQVEELLNALRDPLYVSHRNDPHRRFLTCEPKQSLISGPSAIRRIAQTQRFACAVQFLLRPSTS